MKLNIQNFISFIKKATINAEIDSLKFTVDKDKVISGMRDGSMISILNKENDFISDKTKEFTICFSEPESTVIPFLSQFDEEDVNINIKDNFITVYDTSLKAKLFFVDSTVVEKKTIDPTVISKIKGKKIDIPIDENFLKGFNKIKKIRQLPSIYITVEDIDGTNYLSLKNADNTNVFENMLSFQIYEWKDKDKFNLSFDSNKFIKFFSMLDINRHSVSVHVLQGGETNNSGTIAINSFNNDENFFLMSKAVE